MDLQSLLTPISSAHGRCGEDMTFSSEFDAIQEARRFDDPSLSQGEWVTEIKESDWPSVVRLCEDVLRHKSKDLRIAAWLAEAWCKRHGLRGLAEGYELLYGLANEYWEDIHPLPEDDDLEQRAGLFDWLSQQTNRLIRETPITNSGKGRFSLIDHEAARLAAHTAQKDPEAGDGATARALSMESLGAAAKDSPASFFSGEMQAAQRLREAMTSLQLLLDSQMGDMSPTFNACFESLDEFHRFCSRHVSPVANNEATHEITPESPAPSGLAANGERLEPNFGGTSSGPIRSREQALRELRDIADFFRRTEPHSPVAYLADKAARWGTMPLHVWLRTVVKDDGALSRMEELLGVESGVHGNGTE